MQRGKHAHPAFVLLKEPRPGDRETRMYPPPGKWVVRARDLRQ